MIRRHCGSELQFAILFRLRWPWRAIWISLLHTALFIAPAMALAAEARMPAGVIELDETVISGNQELPKVLYIVPWQQPEGLPEIELEADFADAELFRRVYPPAHRRELRYYEASRQVSESTVNDSKE